MKEKNKLIQRGLKELIEEHNLDKVLEGEVILEIKINEIIPNPFQPRRIFDESKIDELALSIKEHGVFQPIILKKDINNYIIVSGERRYRASKKIGLLTIPAVVRNYSDAKVAEIGLVENLQRENLTAIEEANAYKKIIDELKITQLELSNKIGKSRSHITNIIGLLKLPEFVQDLLLERKISMGHARVLSKIKDDEKVINLSKKIIKENLSVRNIEKIADNKKKEIRKTIVDNNDFKEEIDLIEKHYNLKVLIKRKKIIFETNENNDIREILKKMIK